MARIKLHIYATLRKMLGISSIQLDVNDISDMFQQLIDRFGEPLKKELFEDDSKLRSKYRILVNGRNITLLENLKTKLHNGDIVAILPPIAGGSC